MGGTWRNVFSVGLEFDEVIDVDPKLDVFDLLVLTVDGSRLEFFFVVNLDRFEFNE